MTDNQNDKYIFYTKMAWIIYTLMTIALIVVLVLFVAQDNEERFFYGLMTAAAAYVFRPMDKPFSKLIFKLTGVSQPTEKE
jgi:phosphatidylserine synthase